MRVSESIDQLLERKYDRALRELARNVYDDIISSLNRGNQKSFTERGWPAYLVESMVSHSTLAGVDPGLVKGLVLRFMPIVRTGKSPAFYEKKYKTLTLRFFIGKKSISEFEAIVSDPVRAALNLSDKRIKDRVIHELAHHFDSVRTSGGVFKSTTDGYEDQGVEYYNDNAELNAYYQAGAVKVQAALDKDWHLFWDSADVDELEKWVAPRVRLADIKEYFASDFFDADWLSALTPRNRKRMQKRLADTITDIRSGFRKELALRMEFGKGTYWDDPAGWAKYFRKYGVKFRPPKART